MSDCGCRVRATERDGMASIPSHCPDLPKPLMLTGMLSCRSFHSGFEGETNQELVKQIDVSVRTRARQSSIPLTSGPVGDRLRPK